MCAVQWRKPQVRRIGPSFLRCPPSQIVVITQAPKDFAVLLLHWSPERNSSYPCLGDGCKLCPDPAKYEYAYACAMVWSKSAGRWVQVILPIGDPAHDLATNNYCGQAIIVGKPRQGDESKRLLYYGQADEKDYAKPIVQKPFDVRVPLLRRWGLFAEADALQPDTYVDQGRLPFAPPQAG